jgi:predicted nucleic acid-binding protein
MDNYSLLLSCDSLYLDACALVKIEFEEGLSSNLARFLTFATRFEIYSSNLALGEFIGATGKKEKRDKVITSVGYLAVCRRLMIDFEMNAIKRFEPFDISVPKDRIDFQNQASGLYSKYPTLGGGDLWHMIAARRLQKERSSAGFLTFDKKLVGAATKEGLKTLDGNAMDVTVVEKQLKAAHKLKGT